MSRISPIITNFTSGELSPRLEGRVDISKYFNGCRILENFIVHPHGGATRRPGLRFIAEVKDSTKVVRLIPFVWNEDQAYILEFGHNYIRFYYDQGQLVNGGGAPYEITSPYTAAQLAELRHAQSADVLNMAHPNVAPQKLTRTGHTSWAIATISFTSKPGEWTGTNYPAVVGFFEQRLWWGATPDKPQTLWASVSGSYYDLTTGADDDDALIYTLASNRVDKIVWLEPYKRLIVGTLGSEWTAGASSSLDPITPTNCRFEQENTYGSSGIQGRLVNNNLLFVGKHRYPFRQLTYDYSLDGFKGRDLGILSGHIFGPGISAFDFQQDPDSLLWLVRSDGVMAACTYYPVEEVISWHRHITDGEVESCAVIPGKYGYDELWLVVKRTIEGQTKRYIEMMEGDFGEDVADAFFVDCGLTYDGVPADEISGLDHLEGRTVQVLADGSVHPDCLVSAGSILLNREASKVHVGLGYVSKLQTMRLEAGAQDGTAQGKIKRINSAAIRFYNTVGGKMGVDEDQLDTIPFRSTGDRMDAAVPLFTGDKLIKMPGSYNRDGRIWIEQDQPLPMTVLAIMPQVSVHDQ